MLPSERDDFAPPEYDLAALGAEVEADNAAEIISILQDADDEYGAGYINDAQLVAEMALSDDAEPLRVLLDKRAGSYLVSKLCSVS